MRLVIKVHDQSKGKDGWSHLFISFNGVTKIDEIGEAEVQVTIDDDRNIQLYEDIQFTKHLKMQKLMKDEGKVQTIKYERMTSLSKPETLCTSNSVSENFQNDKSSMLSMNESFENSEGTQSSSFKQLKVKGNIKSSFFKQNHPYKYYKNTSRGPDQYIKSACLKPSEVKENDPLYYRRIAEVAMQQGTCVENLTQDQFKKLATTVANTRSTIILKTGDYQNVASQVSETSSDPRSPIKDPTITNTVVSDWLPHY